MIKSFNFSTGTEDHIVQYWTRSNRNFGLSDQKVLAECLKAASTEIPTFEVSHSPCGRLPDNHNGKLKTEKSGLYVEILPWTQSRAWPFWCPPRQLTLLIWHATSGLA
ncbi:hypothetical protein Y032_0990g3316 [Ancylostoma ceylanicum]|uniref:Uncharacterized protein n=1 Tax=Ancylostoma ceylanicum TaxID=53326 RepID=A0A016W7D2_9BILA|nr:hypothetical protein Y032_0990g3316 [Ancylostoma ceylanicum]